MINKNIRAVALFTLAFVIMLLISLFTTGLRNGFSNKKPKLEYIKPVIGKVKTQKKVYIHNNKKKIKRKLLPIIPKPKKIEKTEITLTQESLTLTQHHRATWYKTEGSRVHREHPTAAYNYAPIGSKLLIINANSGDSIIVEVTDRMGDKRKNHIDLSHKAFGSISNHAVGTIKVIVKILE